MGGKGLMFVIVCVSLLAYFADQFLLLFINKFVLVSVSSHPSTASKVDIKNNKRFNGRFRSEECG